MSYTLEERDGRIAFIPARVHSREPSVVASRAYLLALK